VTALVALLLCASSFKVIAPGVEYAELPFGKGVANVIRIDPAVAELQFALRSKEGGSERTAGAWADRLGFVAAMNAGMFDVDHLSNVGRLIDGPHRNKEQLHGSYQSVLVFGPAKPGLPRAQLLDLDEPGAKETMQSYSSVVQNLRLIKSPGTSVWKKNGRSWSEAAIAQDKKGRVLFVFTRAPHQMADYNELLLASPLEIVRAFHAEGGPEASLSVRSKTVNVDLCGSYETGFIESDRNDAQWGLPNVIGVKAGQSPPQ
jgi:hypothetical protein